MFRQFRLCFPLCVLAGVAAAAEVEFVGRVGTETFHTDNVDLEPEGREETRVLVEAGFSSTAEGRRITSAVDYTVAGTTFVEETSSDEIFHQLGAEGEWEVTPETVFLRGQVQNDQIIVDPSDPLSISDVDLGDDVSNIFTASIEPEFRTVIGNDVVGVATFLYGIVELEGSSEPDSRREVISGRIGNDRTRGRIRWFLAGEQDTVRVETGGESRLSEASVGTIYAATDRLFFTAEAGAENNKLSATEDDEVREDFWELTMDWSPSRRQAITLGVAERSFGTAYLGEWRYAGRRLNLGIAYNEELSSSARRFLADEDDELANSSIVSAVETVFQSERLDVNVNYDLVRTIFTGELYYEDVQSSDETFSTLDSELRGGSLGVEWQFTPTSAVNVTGVREIRDFDIVRTDTIDRVTIQLRQTYRLNLEGTAELAHTTIESDEEDDTEETAFTIAFVKEF